jgi:hypothetical protein
MTDRFPLVIDTDDNKIKELPAGDNLDLQGSGVSNAQTITVSSLSTGTLTVNGTQLSSVAFSGNYDDLTNTPTLFDKDYNSLNNKPFIPSILGDLDNVASHTPQDGQIVVYSTDENRFTFEDRFSQIDLANYNLADLGDVAFSGPVTGKFIKFFAGGWRESNIEWNDVINKPTNVSYFSNDAGYISKTELKDIVAASSDFSDFQNRIANDL